MKIAKLSIQRSSLVVVLFTVLTLLGLFTYTKLNYELIPEIDRPVLSISTLYPGASPSEVETSVTKKIEDAISSLENIDEISSKSKESISIISVVMNEGTDIDQSLQDAQRKVNGILSDLPEDCDPPAVDKFDINSSPILKLGTSAKMSETDFYDLVKNRIQPELSQLKGVANVNMIGGNEREIQVNINADKLNSYNISYNQLVQLIGSSNLDFPTGKVKTNKDQSLLRLAGKFENLSQIENLILSVTKSGAEIRLKDVAEVRDATKETTIISRVNGNNSIGLEIQKQGDANAVEVSELVKEKIESLESFYSDKDLEFVISKDDSEFTLEAANDVMFDLVMAIVLVSAVMLFFLQSIRNSIFVLVAIPASLIATFSAMYMLDFSLNMMTLLALSIVVGSLVDDAIVVIENIYRHMEMGKNRIQASYDAVKELGMTVTAITLVLIAVFFPITLTTGLVANILTSFSLVIVVSIMLSLLVSFTLVPLLTSRFAKLEKINEKSLIGKLVNGFESVINAMNNWLLGILKWALTHKTITLGLVIIALVGSFALIPAGFIGTAFMDPGDRGEFQIQIELDADASIEQTNFKIYEVERFLKQYQEIENVFSVIGKKPGESIAMKNVNFAEISVKLVAKSERDISTDLLSREIKKSLKENVMGIRIKPVPVNLMGSASEPINIQLRSMNTEELAKYTQLAKDKIDQIEGVIELESSMEKGKPELKVVVDRDKMAHLGLSMGEVGSAMQIAFNGNNSSQFRQGEYEYDINIGIDEFNSRTKSDVENLMITNSKRENIYVKQFAKVVESVGPSTLERYDRMPSIRLTAQVIGRSTGDVGNDIIAIIEEMNLPQNIDVVYGGDMKNQEDAFGSLGLALLASIIFVYLIMVALYDSYVYPFVVLFSIPLSVIGALLALALAKQVLSMFSILGILMLVGLVAKNAILVVDFTNELKEKGYALVDALMESTRLRFRPILMTNISMVIGLIPIAIASGAGSEWKNGLGWTLIGGLTSSMFLSLIIVPVVYYIADKGMMKFGLMKKEKIVIQDVEVTVEPEISAAELN